MHAFIHPENGDCPHLIQITQLKTKYYNSKHNKTI